MGPVPGKHRAGQCSVLFGPKVVSDSGLDGHG